MTYLIFIAGVSLNALASFALKSLTINNSLISVETLRNPLLYLTLLLFASNIVLYGLLLQRVNLTVGYPAFVGGTFAFVLLLSFIFLQETLTLSQILGIVLIFGGILLAVR